MSVSYEVLIRLIQDTIQDQYGNPHAAAEHIKKSGQVAGQEAAVSEDTVARIYYRTEDSTYMPKRDSLMAIAKGLGIPVEDERETVRYASEEARRIIDVCLSNYRNAQTCQMLGEFARFLSRMEQYYLRLEDTGRRSRAGSGRKRAEEGPDASSASEDGRTDGSAGTDPDGGTGSLSEDAGSSNS